MSDMPNSESQFEKETVSEDNHFDGEVVNEQGLYQFCLKKLYL